MYISFSELFIKRHDFSKETQLSSTKIYPFQKKGWEYFIWIIFQRLPGKRSRFKMKTTLVICMALMLRQGTWASSDQKINATKQSFEGAQLQGRAAPNPPTTYAKDFNFHSKTGFLKKEVKRLVKCIQDSLDKNPDLPLPYPDKLLRRVINGKDTFIFEYNGSRGFNESCLGDGYKRDLLYRLYDAGCMEYEEKIKFLDSFSCNASKYLECRQIGEEKERNFGEQGTPIMRCLCPDYDKPQTYIKEGGRGFYSTEKGKCVLKVGQKCTINPQGLDLRLQWTDLDFVDSAANTTRIDVVDLRPLNESYPCVNHAFCYSASSKHNGLKLENLYDGRCVCESTYFSTPKGNCEEKMEDPSLDSTIMAFIFIIMAITMFLRGVTFC